MAFLTKQEQITINVIRQDMSLSPAIKTKCISDIKSMARLRQDGFRKPVKIFLNALSHFHNDKLLSGATRTK